MSDKLGLGEEELHAFIDGELPPERAAHIKRLIDSNVALAARVEALLSDKAQLAQLHAEQLDRPTPAKWLRLIEERTRGARPASRDTQPTRRAMLAIAAAMLLILCFGLLSTYVLAPGEDAIIAEALAARQQTMRAQEVVRAEDLAPDRRDDIVSAALDMPLKAPELGRMGYRLDEIRVYSGVSGGKAVGLTYRDAQMRVFNLYLRRPSSPPRVDLFQREGLRICIWQDDVLGTVMLGEMPAAVMARLASLAYSGLNL
jgi:anti-sigma factor RsiW